MVNFMVMEKTADGHLEGLELQHFKIVPRTGEYITINDEEGMGQIYLVIAVIHPMKPAPTAGDIIVRHLGASTEFRKNLQ